MKKMDLSGRAADRLLKVTRTIADRVLAKRIAEATQYRSLDRSYWD